VTKNEFHDHPGWRWCTAQGARDHVLLLGLQSTFREKLEWLEEAETLALRLQGKLDAPPASQPRSRTTRRSKEKAKSPNRESRNLES
jgi:hypothetical protein